MLSKFKAGFILAVLMCISGFSYAFREQRFFVDNHDNIKIILSEKELSKIIFLKEGISRVYSISGELSYEINDDSLYLKVNTQKPVNFFVETSKGNNYKFFAEVNDIEAVQIFIENNKFKKKPAGNKQNYSSKQEEADVNVDKRFSYEEGIHFQKIKKLVAAILTNDMQVIRKKRVRASSKKISQELSLTKDSNWVVHDLIGEKYYLRNHGGQQARINKADFLKEDIEAVYIEKTRLNPGEATILIIIKKSDDK
jgi:hypothetical protein